MRWKIILAILVLAAVLAIPPATASWQIETVDSGNAGTGTSLVIGTDGIWHISYYDAGENALKYAYYDGSWHTATVDTVSVAGSVATSIQLWYNHPCIAYGSSDGIKYAENLGGGWTSYLLDSQGSGLPSMVVMPSGDIAVCYYAGTTGELRCVLYDKSKSSWDAPRMIKYIGAGGTWVSAFVDYHEFQDGGLWSPDDPPQRTVGIFFKEPNAGDHQVGVSYIVLHPGHWTGAIPYVADYQAINGSGSRISGPLSMVDRGHTYGRDDYGYYFGNRQRMYSFTTNEGVLMYGDDGIYLDQQIMMPSPLVADGVVQHASYNSLARDRYDQPCIVFTDRDTGALRFAWNDGFWHAATVAATPAASPSLAFDAAGNPVISYYDITAQSLKVARSSDIFPAIPASVSYQQYVTLIEDQFGTHGLDAGGCPTRTSKHMLDILKEMEAPYTPDISFAFLHYYNTMAMRGEDAGKSDPNVPWDKLMNTFKVLTNTGSPPETSFPSNFDLLGWEGLDLLDSPPPDEAYTEALNYRISDFSYHSGFVFWPQSALTERLLALNGPLYCVNLFDAHVITLIGYDHAAQTFTLIDSANWLKQTAGIKTISYADYDKQMKEILTFNLVFKNRPTPLVHPYTARINVTHPDGRKNLEVQVSAGGEDALWVWNENNRIHGSENIQSLVIDVPLPEYASSSWPPSAGNSWSVTVIDHGTNPGSQATVNGITLVKRTKTGETYSVATYEPSNLPLTVPAQGWANIRIPSPAPRIISVSPDTYIPGGPLPIVVVDVNGANFFSGKEGTVVKLTKSGETDIIAEGVTVDTATHLDCVFTIPAGTANGKWNVVVVNPDGQSAVLTDGFTIAIPVPTVTGISPSTGALGALVDIFDLHGTNFTVGSGPAVSLNRTYMHMDQRIQATNVTVVETDQITCTIPVPEHERNKGAWTVNVTTPDGRSAYLFNGFTIVDPVPAPTVTAVTPNTGILGTLVSISDFQGTNFVPGSTTTFVTFQSKLLPPIIATNVSVVSASKITCTLTVPDNVKALGSYNVTVTNPDGQTGRLGKGFTVIYPAPALTGIVPSTGVKGTTVFLSDIQGSDFRSGATVSITRTLGDSVAVTNVTVISSRKITGSVAIPSMGEAGPWDVVVRNDDDQFDTLHGGFTSTAPPSPPSVSSVTPASGLRGTSVFITSLAGSGFLQGATVRLGRAGWNNITAYNITVAGSNRITCTITISTEAGTGAWDVVVTNPDGQYGTLPGGFTIISPAPVVSGITPGASLTGETKITTLSGENFDDGAEVSLSRPSQATITAGAVTVLSTEALIATIAVPPDASPGTWDVVVTNEDGKTGTLAGGFVIAAYPQPAIASVCPDSAYLGEPRVNLTVEGTNFLSNSYVRWNSGTRLTTYVSGTQLKATISAPDLASPGKINISVVNPPPGGSSSGNVTFTIFNDYIYAAPGSAGLPTDPDCDGVYEDLNGNGRLDFADVVLYFTQMDWIAVNEPVTAFDLNGNGRIDFADIVALFNEI